jgi:hydrogenase 3 maturation protease
LFLNQLGFAARRHEIIGRGGAGAGVLVARRLANRATDHLLVIEAGQAPENRTTALRRFAPDLVLIVDATGIGGTPGTVGWISEECIDGLSASTHSLPLSMLARYLKLNCDVMFLGIQPASNEFGEKVSAEVLQAVSEIVEGLDELLFHA